MSNISGEKETANIGDQISAYLKANTSALGELIRQIIYESNETRRQLIEVKNSLEQVHEGMKILGERVAALSINENSSTLEETKQQHNLEMDRLVKVFEIATSIKKETPTNPQISALTSQQLIQMQQQQQQQQMAAFQQQVLQQQNLARMMQMQQVQQYNPLSMLQGMIDSNNSKSVSQPVAHIVSQNQVGGQGASLLKAQLSQPPPPVSSTNTTTLTKKEETASGSVSQTLLFGNNTPNSQSIFGKAQVQSKPFFSNTSVTVPTAAATETNEVNKSTVENDDEAPEDFEPDVQFKPVVPLPDLVKVKTGEEGENILFQEQCKLFRFHETQKEFKERGVGKIKILKNETSGVVRVVMRREQVHKVCANFMITKGMAIQLKPGSKKVCIFKCFDNSDEEPAHVTLCAKFGEESHCCKFMSNFLEATESEDLETSKKNGSKGNVSETPKKDEAKKWNVTENVQEDEESDENTADESYGSSTEDYDDTVSQPFKVPEKIEGSWNCDVCYASNPPSESKCMCCEAVRGSKDSDEKSKATLKGNVFTNSVSSQFSFGFGTSNTSVSDDKSVFGVKAADNEGKNTERLCLFEQNKETSKNLSLFGSNKESVVTTTPTSEQEKHTEKNTVSLFNQMKVSNKTPSLESSTITESAKQVPFSFASVTVKPSNEPSPFQFTPGKTPNNSFSLFGGSKSSTPSTESKSLFGQNSFGGSLKDTPKAPEKKEASVENKSVFGQNVFGASLKDASKTSDEKGSSTESKSVFGKSIFGASLKDASKTSDEREASAESKSIFGQSIFGASLKDASNQAEDQSNKANESKILFSKTFSFGKKDDSNGDKKSVSSTSESTTFGSSSVKPIFGSTSFSSGANTSISNKSELTGSDVSNNKSGNVFGGGSQNVSFSTIAKSGTNFLSNSTKDEGDPFKVDLTKHKLFSSNEDKVAKTNEDEEANEDDYQPDIHFEPVIPLPDLIDVKTGEEDEEKLLSYKVRLYIMKTIDGASEWKERGTGELRLLKHPDAETYRIVMRRDQTQKLCANMRLYKHMKFTYNKMKDKVLLFKATDCSDNMSNTIPETYCIRFSTSDDAVKFSEVVNNITDNIL